MTGWLVDLSFLSLLSISVSLATAAPASLDLSPPKLVLLSVMYPDSIEEV